MLFKQPIHDVPIRVSRVECVRVSSPCDEEVTSDFFSALNFYSIMMMNTTKHSYYSSVSLTTLKC